MGGHFYSDDDLVAGAENDLYNRAATKGANWVELGTAQLSATGGATVHNQANVVGRAYDCDVGAYRHSPQSAPTSTVNFGSERGPCYGNGTCNAGLTCASGLCVRVP